MSLSLAQPEDIDFVLYNSVGEEINRVSKTNFTVGSETLDVSDLSPGIYYCKVLTPMDEQVRKFVLVD